MNEDRPMFILAGNASYENRGCEAIVRGTVNILRKQFRDPRFICFSHFQSRQQYEEQCQQETDDAIVHLSAEKLDDKFNKQILVQKFWKPETWVLAYQYFFNRDRFYSRAYHDMLPYIDEADAVLSIGGDNYSLDYGVPVLFTALDNLVVGRGKPIVIWGASVGPFSSIPTYERYMGDHLRNITGIFARESATVEYLSSIGVKDNVCPVADPAFLMDPVKPGGIEDELHIKEEAIGLNLSPLMAKYATGGDLEQWTKVAASLIESIAKTTEMPLYLIPHVTSQHSNDFLFMQRALSLVHEKNTSVTLVSPKYNAEETKWIISRMALFAGARTHSTIAALSSGVPTLSFAYSIKAKGINKDIFGHTDYCLNPRDLDTKIVSGKIKSMLDQKAEIRRDLNERIPAIQRSALNAGMKLQQIIGRE